MDDRVVIGQLVKSKSGRDKGRYFLVLSIDPEKRIAFLVDGEKRGINNPKKKNICHIQVTNVVKKEFAQKVKEGFLPSDRDLRRYLKSGS
ncbi:MAG: KOW domain-containing RNA-binding protein [Desulfitobacteriaceae bacterium]|nr:KOW domain-containing RNA-binding protein [Desulfitobacteriaceae bacterium]MDD4751986.1 KOW domain-containing RNA-binding protein [Desulfitobacteriaceae bacterium]